MRSKKTFTVAVMIYTVRQICNDHVGDSFREITRMKQARGAAGLPGATEEDDFQVVPVESTSEHIYIPQTCTR